MEKTSDMTKIYEIWFKRHKETYEEAMNKLIVHAKSIDEVPWLTMKISKKEMRLIYPVIIQGSEE